jgi:hypothetical protein
MSPLHDQLLSMLVFAPPIWELFPIQGFFVICVTQPGVLSVVVADESSRSSLHLV